MGAVHDSPRTDVLQRRRSLVGQSAVFWGGMMGFASLLIVIGIYGHRALLEAGGRSARIGFWLVLIGLGTTCRVALLVTGLLLSAAFLMNLVPQETLDRFEWYRLYGILSNVLFGLGWVVFGVSLARHQRAAVAVSPAAEAG